MLKNDKVKKIDLLKLKIKKLEKNVSNLIDAFNVLNNDLVVCDMCGVCLSRAFAAREVEMGIDLAHVLKYAGKIKANKIVDEKYYCRNCVSLKNGPSDAESDLYKMFKD